MARVALHVLGNVADPRRRRRRVVDDDIELSSLERGGIGAQIADELLDLALEHVRARLVAIEERDAMAATQRVVHLLRSGEAGTTQNENVERFLGGRRFVAFA